MNYGEILRELGDTAGSIREQGKVLEQDSRNVYAIVYLARTYLEAGDVGRARLTLERASLADRQNFQIRMAWAVLLAREGKRAAALKEMDNEVLKYAAMVPPMTAMVGEFYAILGDTPKALEWLESAVRSGDERAEWFRRDPLLASVRNQPRFQQILDSIALRRQQRATTPPQ